MSEIWSMLELIQFPFSPFCIPARRMLEFAGVKFKLVNVPPQDRSLVWKLTIEDFDLFGMLENFLYSGHYALPKSHPHPRNWHRRMKSVRR
jgi:glutathione S-transferase